MKEAELIDLAIRMRAAQRQYFKTKLQEYLVTARRLERQFDEAAADCNPTIKGD